MQESKLRAPRNKTQILSEGDTSRLYLRLLTMDRPVSLADCVGRTIHGDTTQVLPLLPRASTDLLIIDPPYNLTRTYDGSTFARRSLPQYEAWTNAWVELVTPLLEPTASIYVCSEWRSSGVIQRVLERHFIVKNRITWEREKGRGAARDWKNNSEDTT